MKKVPKRLIAVLLLFTVVFSSIKPATCSAAAKGKIPGFPPASQTSFKKWSTVSVRVSR